MAARRSASIVSWGNAASPSAISSARSRWRPSGTTSVTSPIASASAASTMRPRQDQVERRGPRPDDARQPLGAAVDQRHAPAALGEAERGRLGGDAQVAPERQLQPARQAPAGDGGDRRLRRRNAREAERAARVVEPRAEALDAFRSAPAQKATPPGAGEHHDAGVVVGLEAVVGLLEQLARWARRPRCAAPGGRSSRPPRRLSARTQRPRRMFSDPFTPAGPSLARITSADPSSHAAPRSPPGPLGPEALSGRGRRTQPATSRPACAAPPPCAGPCASRAGPGART